MTFDEYISNPMGKKNAVYSQRFMFQKLYQQKYELTMAREANGMRFTLYKSKNEKRFIAHFYVPSEVVPRFVYDVVVEFTAPSDEVAAEKTLKNYQVKFFANDPAFVFTFAHAFRTAGMFFDALSSKMSRLALKEKPKETNPKEIIGYVKSIYFAYIFYKGKGLYNKSMWYDATPINMKTLTGSITHADVIYEKRTAAGAKLAKKSKPHSVSSARAVSNPVAKTSKSSVSKAVTTTRTVRKVGTVARTKRK